MGSWVVSCRPELRPGLPRVVVLRPPPNRGRMWVSAVGSVFAVKTIEYQADLLLRSCNALAIVRSSNGVMHRPRGVAFSWLASLG